MASLGRVEPMLVIMVGAHMAMEHGYDGSGKENGRHFFIFKNNYKK
jgi:hypothetical protein